MKAVKNNSKSDIDSHHLSCTSKNSPSNIAEDEEKTKKSADNTKNITNALDTTVLVADNEQSDKLRADVSIRKDEEEEVNKQIDCSGAPPSEPASQSSSSNLTSGSPPSKLTSRSSSTLSLVHLHSLSSSQTAIQNMPNVKL